MREKPFIVFMIFVGVVVAAGVFAIFKSCQVEQQIAKESIPPYTGYGMSEWVSPDGVHYWMYNNTYQFGMSPRYDSNGNLVIDRVEVR